jgi:hypothetical protein
LLGLSRRQPDRTCLRVGEERLWHGVRVGSGGVAAPRSVIDRLSGGPRGDRPGSHPCLVLALVGQQCAVVGVTHRVQPAVGDIAHPTGFVDVEP